MPVNRLMRVAIPPIGGPQWLGGWNYMVNMAAALGETGEAEPVLFLGEDTPEPLVRQVEGLKATTVVVDRNFDAVRRQGRLGSAIVTGVDRTALGLFRRHGVDIAFETAAFLGSRFPIPTVAWIPDFQHRRLPQLFSPYTRFRREIGFRLQISGGRDIMLSSRNAEADCLSFYPRARGRTHVVGFAVKPPEPLAREEINERLAKYDLPEHFFFLPNQLWPHKNHDIAIEAVALLRDQKQDVVVVATGHAGGSKPAAANAAALQEKVGVLGLDRHFRLLGSVPYPDVQAMLWSASALINPSRFEGWSTTVEEAKVIGLPMILSDIPVHREQAEGIASFFNPDDPAALAALLTLSPSRDARRADSSLRLAAENQARYGAELLQVFTAAKRSSNER